MTFIKLRESPLFLVTEHFYEDWVVWANKMGQQVKVPATKPDGLSLISGTSMVGGQSQLASTSGPLTSMCAL